MKEAGHILPVVFIIFWLYHVAHRTIVPPPETEPMPPVLEQGVLTTRPPGKSLSVFFAHISGFTFDLSPFDRDLGFLGSSAGKESGCNAGDLGSIPGLGRSPGEENSYLLQYSCHGQFHGQRSLAGYSPWGLQRISGFRCYTVEVTNRFKGLDLIDRKPDELWTEVRRSVTLYMGW